MATPYTPQIDEPTEAILKARARWKINRDIMAGEAAVKAAGEKYLPRGSSQTASEYQAYAKRVMFFPAASRTREGLIGLVTRKAPTLDCPDRLKAMFDTITNAGQSYEDLAEYLLNETLQTAFPGMLVDHPVTAPLDPGKVATLADVEAANDRPFVALYTAETILEVKSGVHANRQVLTRVRLLEDGGDTVRELRLDNGVYTITMHYQIEGEGWIADAPMVPLRNGQPINFIPFVLSTLKARTFAPCKGPMDDLCDLNVHLFNASALAFNSRWFSSAPMIYVLGAEIDTVTVAPGETLNFPFHTNEHPVVIDYLEFSGAGQKSLDDYEASILDKMAKLGSNILASERSAAEAAETHAIRRSSENSVLAGIARAVSRALTETLDICAWWQGEERGSVKCSLNTDFVPQPMSAEERKAALAEFMAGAISYETYIDMLMAGEVLPDTFDRDEEEQRLANDAAKADRPVQEEPAQDTTEE